MQSEFLKIIKCQFSHIKLQKKKSKKAEIIDPNIKALYIFYKSYLVLNTKYTTGEFILKAPLM